MSGLLGVGVDNACMAVVVALLAAATASMTRRPAIVHTMWLIVFLELLIPPVFEIGVLPKDLFGLWTEEAVAPVVAIATPLATGSTPVAEPLPRWDPILALGIVWILGAFVALVLAVGRGRRFGRQLGSANDAPLALRRRLEQLSGTLGLRSAPALRVVEARISPCVWQRPRGVELLFPAGLLRRLDRDEIDALLVHELAHVLRRDHWVRYVELLAGAVFWWHPVVWWARSRMRRAEEQCCDQIVLRVLAAPVHYARGLVKTIEYLAGTGRPVPALASGVGEARQMEERLTMIMSEDPASRTPRTARALLALVALGVLLVVPTWTDRAPMAADRSDRDAETVAERESVLQLERRASEVKAELDRLRAVHAELQHALVQRQLEEKMAAMRLEAKQLDGTAETDRAQALRLQMAEIEQLRLREEAKRVAELEDETRRMKERLERERRAGAGPRREADRLAAELAELLAMARDLEREIDDQLDSRTD